MKTTIDSAGRLVIPREVRREAGLRAGSLVEVRWKDGRIEIEPALLPVKFERHGRLTIAVPSRAVPPLQGDDVEDLRRRLRRERRGESG